MGGCAKGAQAHRLKEGAMTLKPTDMLEIQSAIDAYERKFPRRPTPTAEVALAWRLGKKAWAKRQAAQALAEDAADNVPVSNQFESDRPEEVIPSFAHREAGVEGNGMFWLLRQLRFRWRTWNEAFESSAMFEDSGPLVQGVLRVGLWGVAAVLVVSVFLLGAVVGGLK
jgi:hypothetical protein